MDFGRPGQWRNVTDDFLEQWRGIFDGSTEGVVLSSPCPVCKAAALRRWFDLHRPEPLTSHGVVTTGRGAEWQWCRNCGTFEHLSGRVPAWWSAPFAIDVRLATVRPTLIDDALTTAGL